MKKRKSIKKLLFTISLAACTSIVGIISGFLLIKPVYHAEAKYYITENSKTGTIYSSNELKPLFLSGTFFDTISLRLGTRYTPKQLKKMINIDADNYSMFFNLEIKSRKASDVFQIHKIIENMISGYIEDATKNFLSVDIIEPAVFPDKCHRPGIIFIGIISSLPGAAAALFVLSKKKVNYITNPQNLSTLYNGIPIAAQIPSYGITAEKKPSENNFEFTAAFRSLSENMHLDDLLSDSKPAAYVPDGNTIMINRESSGNFKAAFRSFHTEINRFRDFSKKIILITSSISGEGKTTAAVNLAITIAAEGKSVLLVEGNMHNRRMSRAFNLNASVPGLAEVAEGFMSSKEAILLTQYRSLYILPAGNYSRNPLGLYTRTETLVSLYDLKSLFDYIIIDTPPLNAFPDALALTGISDLIYLTVRSGFTTEPDISNALKSFQLSDIKISGFILNDLPPSANPIPKPVKPPIANDNPRYVSSFKI